MYCPHCNHDNKANAHDCEKCGWEFGLPVNSDERTPSAKEIKICIDCKSNEVYYTSMGLCFMCHSVAHLKVSNQTPLINMKKQETPTVTVDAKYRRIRFNDAALLLIVSDLSKPVSYLNEKLKKVKLKFDMPDGDLAIDLSQYVKRVTKEKSGGFVFRCSALVDELVGTQDSLYIINDLDSNQKFKITDRLLTPNEHTELLLTLQPLA